MIHGSRVSTSSLAPRCTLDYLLGFRWASPSGTLVRGESKTSDGHVAQIPCHAGRGPGGRGDAGL